MNICMICTGTDVQLLSKMLDSIEHQQPGLNIHVIVVMQASDHQFTSENFDITTLNTKERMGLSKARNLGLKHLFERSVEQDFVMFPDDDTTFDAVFFDHLMANIQKGALYLGRVCSEEDGSDYKHYPRVEILKGKEELLPYVASVSLLLPYEIVQQLGFFDEKLGAGAEFASSEDLDYYLRAIQYGQFTFLRGLRNFHPSRFGKYSSMTNEQLKKRFKGYTDGYLFVLFRYGMESKANSLVVRAYGGALVSLMKGNLRLVPIYIWLANYRLKTMRYFKQKRTEDPKFFEYAV